MDEERTEQPTPRSRQRARERGQVAKSRELTGTFVLLFGFLTLFLIINWWRILAEGLFTDTLGNLNVPAINAESAQEINVYIMKVILAFMWPVMASTAVAAILFNLLQTRGTMSLESIRPKLSNINPINGVRRMFSTRGFVELLKAVFKIVLVSIVAYTYIRNNLGGIAEAQLMEPEQYFPYFGTHAMHLGMWIIAILLLLSIIDYMYQYWQHEKDLMLTKQEAKEEYKQMEGDPLVKSRMRQRQRQIAMTAMLREVPKADVVITNPEHVAVALKYESDMPAPQVVAKGKGVIAERIIQVAKDFEIHIHRDPPLARAIYQMVEVGGVIPYDFYVAIAEVLAFVYRTKKKYRKQRKQMATMGSRI